MRTSTALLAVCALGLIHAVVAHDARAEDQKAPTAETTVMTDKARQLYEDGLALSKKSKWLDARASFLAAWSLNQHWQIAGILADCEFELGKYRDAAEHASYYLRNSPLDRHDRAEELLNKAKAMIVTLTVAVASPGAEVLIDDVAVGRAPLAEPLFVEPGARKVTVRLAGRPDVVKTIRATAGAAEVVKLSFPSESIPGPALVPISVAGPNKAIAVSGVAITGLGLGVGVVLAVLSGGKAADADAQLATLTKSGTHGVCQTHANECDSIDSALRGRDTLANGAMGSFIGAGAVGLATLGYVLFTSKASRNTGVKVIPAMATGYGSVSIVGAW